MFDHIFFRESFVLNPGFFGLLLVICSGLSGFEKKFELRRLPYGVFFRMNALWSALMALGLLVLEFIVGWRRDWLGGEIPSVVILFSILIIGSFLTKKILYSKFGLQFSHNNFMAVFAVSVYFALPLMLVLYVFALGSAWKN